MFIVYLLAGTMFMGLIFGIVIREKYCILYFLIGSILFGYLSYLDIIYSKEINKITSETELSSITNFVFTQAVAEKIDNQYKKNATCNKDICVYTGTIQQSGPGFELTLLSQQNIIFECRVQNKCKLSSYVEHGNKYLKVSVN